MTGRRTERPEHPERGADAVRQFTVEPDDDGIRLDRWFKRHLPQVGFATISRWARTGQVRVDGGRVKPEDRLAAGQLLRVPPGGDRAGGEPARRELSADEQAAAEAMLVLRTQAALVLNKPPGLATQGGTKTTRHVDGLLEAYAGPDEPRPRLVHRLDKDTSGVLLVARTPGSAAYFAKRFAGRSAKKIYWALVVGVPDIAEGTVDAPIGKQPGTGGEKMHVDQENGQPARTLYRVVDRAGNQTAWVELQPMTGRTHQLRVHMAAIGHPIVGDGKYGGQEAFLTGSISRKMHLHARRLVIDGPGGKIDVTADLPEHFAASMAQLGFDPAASDAAPEEGPRERNAVEKKQAARAHAKQYRKERRGERQRRGSGGERSGRSAADKPARGKPSADKGVKARKAPGQAPPSEARPGREAPRKARFASTGEASRKSAPGNQARSAGDTPRKAPSRPSPARTGSPGRSPGSTAPPRRAPAGKAPVRPDPGGSTPSKGGKGRGTGPRPQPGRKR